jgi:hypothetical protein
MKLHRFMLMAVVLLALSSFATAYPIPPQSLRALCKNSPLIVVAKVEAVRPIKSEDEDWPDAIARLRIASILKGSANGPVVEVQFSPAMICPAPPKYAKGSTVIAFLSRDEGDKFYYTWGLSYGAKAVSESALQVYTERIREVLEILKQNDSPRKDEQTIDWLVRCAEEPATRWEGAYEFTPDKGLRLAGEAEEFPDLAAMLTSEQKSRLSSVLFRSTTIDEGELCLIQLLKNDERKRVVAFILNYLKTIVDTPLYSTFELMTTVAEKLESQQASALIEEFERSSLRGKAEASRKKIVLNKFISLVESLATT